MGKFRTHFSVGARGPKGKYGEGLELILVKVRCDVGWRPGEEECNAAVAKA